MRKILSYLLVISGLMACWPVVMTEAREMQGAITIAILPCSDPVSTYKRFKPLAEYLDQETGFEVKLVVPKDALAFEQAIKGGKIHFAFQGPHTYVQLSEWYRKDALIKALTWKGEAFESGVVIVRTDSGITQVGDLRGKSVMFGPRLSATKWVAAKLLFEESGLDIGRDLQSYVNGGCCEDISFNVYLKAVDAGVVCDHFMGTYGGKRDDLGTETKQLDVIAKTKPVPTRVFAPVFLTGLDIVRAVNASLLKLDKNNPAHREILRPAELSRFIGATHDEYEYLITLTKHEMHEGL